MTSNSDDAIHSARRRAIAPRKRLLISDWADINFRISRKSGPEHGRWRTSRNPPLQEPLDALSVGSSVHDMVLKFPIQFGKSVIGTIFLGYIIDHIPGPVMYALPGEVSMNKWINQKLNPMLEEVPVVRNALATVNSRDARNCKEFKDFLGGQLYVEHAGSTARMKSSTVKYLVVDELTEFVAAMLTGDDPLMLLGDRTSAFPSTYKILYISSPGTKGICRTDDLYQKSDQRRYYVPCPHCDEMQPLEWSGLHWDTGGERVRYVCRECGCEIDEYHKTEMIRRGRWVAENPGAKMRGYTINCLYYQIGLGPRWSTLVEMWLDAQNDPAKLKTFVNSRLAEAWIDPSMERVHVNAIADRAESYALRTAPVGVCVITAGVDTQDNRLAVHIVGWGRNMAAWTIDYVELMGDPENDEVWLSLYDLLNAPIEHENGHWLHVQAVAHDAGGHRTEAVKSRVREKNVRRHMCVFGAVPNNAPVLSKGKAQDVNYKGDYNKRGVMIYHVGTVGIKNKLFGRMSTDADKKQEARLLHFSEELPREFFNGMVSETYNPRTNRYDKKRGVRNEMLDTWVYAYAAAHHPELRLHLYTSLKWDALLDQYAEPTRGQRPMTEAKPLARPQRDAPTVKKPKRNSTLLWNNL